jgi:hypothetical protein
LNTKKANIHVDDLPKTQIYFFAHNWKPRLVYLKVEILSLKIIPIPIFCWYRNHSNQT